MNYTELVATKTTDGSIKNWVNWDKVPSTTILTAAEAFLYSRLRLREMEHTRRDLAIADGAESLTLPDDYIAAKTFRLRTPNAGTIDILDPEYYEEKRCEDQDGNLIEGTPTFCKISGDPAIAEFDVKADQAYVASMVYYRRPAALSGGNPTNFLTQRYPWLVLNACLHQAYLHKKDWTAAERAEKELEKMIFTANSEKDMEAQVRRFEPYSEGRR